MLTTQNFKQYIIQRNRSLSEKSIQAVLDLAKEGATVPFMARYRKEKTGNLSEVHIRQVVDEYEKWGEMVKRKKFVLDEIERQGSLTESLKRQIQQAQDLSEVEELYRPYKRQRKTKSKLAKDAGLEPLAQWILALGEEKSEFSESLEVKAKEFLNSSSGYATYKEVLRGAQHIIAETLYTDSELRKAVKEDYFRNAIVVSKPGKKIKPNTKYSAYVDYREKVQKLLVPKASYRYLALRRGWQEGELTLSLEGNNEELLSLFEKKLKTSQSKQGEIFLKECADLALKSHVIPSIVNELHSFLKNESEKHAIDVFSSNLERILLASPYGSKVVLGVDPGLKTGCKLALINDQGGFVSSTVLDILGDGAEENAKKMFEEIFKQIKIEIIAVGNGTGGREAEFFIRKVLKNINNSTPVVLISEAGASVYSASDIAREEFPELDVTVRGAISIARRLQDPLAELVKIEPKSLGVGQYQHDVSPVALKKSLHNTVESCVNQVGVNLNTASVSLLQYVSGIGPSIALSIVEQRQSKGRFLERSELLEVKGFSSKTFEQAAGFLRVTGGPKPLDGTGIHPERYSILREMAKELGFKVSELFGERANRLEALREKWAPLVGEFTFEDIVRELKKPGRDPRDSFEIFQFREDIHTLEDLKEEMVCPGIVSNVTNFGAFVDIGVHQDGLVHLSQMSHSFVSDPKEVLSPGDRIQVKILEVDHDKKKINLTMLLTGKPQPKKKSTAKGARKKATKKTATSGKPSSTQKRNRRAAGKDSKRSASKSSAGRSRKTPFNNPFVSALNGMDDLKIGKSRKD